MKNVSFRSSWNVARASLQTIKLKVLFIPLYATINYAHGTYQRSQVRFLCINCVMHAFIFSLSYIFIYIFSLTRIHDT